MSKGSKGKKTTFSNLNKQPLPIALSGSRPSFDRILSRENPADILFEDDQCIAFKDYNPVAPLHILVIPKKKVDMLSHIQEGDTMLLGQLLYVAKTLADSLAPDGYRLVINNGDQGGQTIYHLNVHVIGGRPLRWPPG